MHRHLFGAGTQISLEGVQCYLSFQTKKSACQNHMSCKTYITSNAGVFWVAISKGVPLVKNHRNSRKPTCWIDWSISLWILNLFSLSFFCWKGTFPEHVFRRKGCSCERSLVGLSRKTDHMSHSFECKLWPSIIQVKVARPTQAGKTQKFAKLRPMISPLMLWIFTKSYHRMSELGR